MYGPGPVTQGPKPADPTTAVVLRVILTVVPVVTLGFLAWVSMLYLAVLRKRSTDWLVLAVAVGMAVIAVVCFGLSHDDDWQANTGATLILICMFGGAVYFLVADVLRYRAARRGRPAAVAGYPPQNPYATGFGGPVPMARPAQQGYPAPRQYPGPARAATPPPVNRPSTPPPANRPAAPGPVGGPSTPPRNPTPPPNTAPNSAPHSTPQPAPRIDQVRAELDELSDFLRKERGEGRDSGEGGAAR
ncbi:hypothetical protein RVR_3665 [Actinacidiphila reveromycinica]|uniref:Integral membrane protein n=2 Tax=Actinacidiphila reveromycinica TaxID=659352 RepID=A0A7U3US65_9ACTN|nr:hypothetical protein RVR_3665 [Streptomyces sp. SN-593]